MSDRMLSDEILLALIKKNSGGGGGGTSDYNQLENLPKIGGETVIGNMSLADLGIASATDLASVAAALAGKQDALTAGNYVSISNDGTINVTKAIGVYDSVRYVFTPEGDGYWMRVAVYINDVKRFEQAYQNTSVFEHVVIMDLIEFWYGGDGYYWHYRPLIDSKEHAKDIVIRWYYNEMDVHEETFDVPQDDSTTLATKGDLSAAVAEIKPVDYSTTERKTGRKWIDGKDIYARTYPLILNSVAQYSRGGSENKTYLIGLTGYGIAFVTRFIGVRNGMIDSYPIANTMYFSFDSSVGGVFVAHDISSYIDLYVTVEYTKATT